MAVETATEALVSGNSPGVALCDAPADSHTISNLILKVSAEKNTNAATDCFDEQKVTELLLQEFDNGFTSPAKSYGATLLQNFARRPGLATLHGQVPANENDTRFAHVSLMYLKPFRPTFILLLWRASGMFGILRDERGWPTMKAHLDLLDTLDTRKSWTISTSHVTVDRDTTTDRLCDLHIIPSGKPASEVWAGERAERRRQGRAPAVEWQVVADSDEE